MGKFGADLRCNKGFTLIELLVVVAIIGILSSLVMGIYGYASRKAYRSQATAEMERLKNAFEEYRLYYGNVPQISGFLTNAAFNGIRQQLTNDMPNAVRDLKFVDPWLRSYMYTNISKHLFGIRSLGPNATDATDDLDNSSGNM